MKRGVAILATLVAVALVSACTTYSPSGSISVGSGTPRNPEDVIILNPGAPVPEVFIPAGHLTYEPSPGEREDVSWLNIARLAAKNGVDAVRYERAAVGFWVSATRFECYVVDHSRVPKVDYSADEAYAYFDSSRLDHIEGVWNSTEANNRYEVAIRKDSDSRDYVMSILSSENSLWKEGQIKARLTKTASSQVFNVEYWLRDHSKMSTTAILHDENFLEIDSPYGGVRWVKQYAGDASGEDFSELSSGSGFVVSTKGHIVTNHHVIEDAETVVVLFPDDDREYECEIVLKDKNNDLAILKMKDPPVLDAVPYSIARSSSVENGEECYSLGYPLPGELSEELKITSGIVSSTVGYDNNPVLIQISNPIQPGNSGGPLFSHYGHLIGIVVSSLSASYFYESYQTIPQNVNFAIKTDYLINLLSLIYDGEVFVAVGQMESEMSSSEVYKAYKRFIPIVLSRF